MQILQLNNKYLVLEELNLNEAQDDAWLSCFHISQQSLILEC